MQIKIFSIPTYGGESFTEELNLFLRSKKVLSLEQEFIQDGNNGSYWSFCVKYIEDGKVATSSKPKKDYKEILDKGSYERYKKLREIRKNIAKDEGIPAYLVLTNEEMAKIAELDKITLEGMRKIKGIGAKKVEKYGAFFVKGE